jgi:hypothetical protein
MTAHLQSGSGRKRLNWLHNKVSAICAWLLLGSLLGTPAARLTAAETPLDRDFLNPPAAAKPWVYWFWLNGNITREGITADLEAMQRVGIGGVLIMEVDQGTPVGPVVFMSDAWRALFKHMATEAQRLGIEVNINNDAGWNGSGGPWIPLDKAMQVVVTSEQRVPGGKKFVGNLPQPVAKKGYYRDIAVLAFPSPKVMPNTDDRVKNLAEKSVSWSYISGYSMGTDRDAKVPGEVMIDQARIIDLTDRMDAAGKLVWDAPALGRNDETSPPEGEWTVVRFGHTFTGAESHPAPATGIGPECDKLSKEGIEAQFNGMVGKLLDDVGQLAGKSIAATHVDSWEIGGQNWTPKMREEFKRLRGYDMLPFMPILTGRFIGSVDITERFLWDLRQTVSELLTANYIGHLGKLAHDHGLRLSMETYGTPALDMDVINSVDEPMCEFWWSGGGRLDWTLKAMASAAHVNGRPVVGAEAFTSNRRERWRGHPANIKARGDRVLCGGVNRMVFHRYAMQPWARDLRPGVSMGPYGLHYERTQTWWENSKAWHQYLARCQYMLRQGTFVADVLSLQPEEPMQRFNLVSLTGYDYDGISPQAFLNQASVQDGRLVLTSGMRYRMLALSTTNSKNMSLPMLKKIKSLVEAGAVILGAAPEATPGMADYQLADQELKKLATELWGTDASEQERVVGKGRVFRGMQPEAVLTKLQVVPDFIADKKLNWIHRAIDGVDVYFVATGVEQPVNATCTFRVSGRQPELWDPETGSMRRIPGYRAESNGCTTLPMQFGPSGAAFVVFRDKTDPAQQVLRVTHNGAPVPETAPAPATAAPLDLVQGTVSQAGAYELHTADNKTRRFEIAALPEPLEITGPWELSFPPNWGAPAKVTLDKLVSWSQHPDPGVKYFSGTATYSKKFAIAQNSIGKNQRHYLDLGKVAVMAEVILNGKNLGILWKDPFRIDITAAVQPGENILQVAVVNLWINRMIGDEFLPADCELNADGSLRAWPTWLLEGKPNPSGRFTFSTWRLWNKNEALQDSGLIGPVRILTCAAIPDSP